MEIPPLNIDTVARQIGVNGRTTDGQ